MRPTVHSWSCERTACGRTSRAASPLAPSANVTWNVTSMSVRWLPPSSRTLPAPSSTWNEVAFGAARREDVDVDRRAPADRREQQLGRREVGVLALPNDTLPPRWLTAANRPGEIRSTVTCRCFDIHPACHGAVLHIDDASGVAQRVTEARARVVDAAGGPPEVIGAIGPGSASSSASPTTTPRRRRVARRQAVEPAHLPRRRRGDEPVGERRRGGAARRQPVHALRRHDGGSATQLDRRRPARTRRAARRPRRRRCGRGERRNGRFRRDAGSLVNDGPVTVLLEGPAHHVAAAKPGDHHARMTGRSPRRVTTAAPAQLDRGRMTARSLTLVRSMTSPSGVDERREPGRRPCTTHRSISKARSLAGRICCVCTIVRVAGAVRRG